MKQKAFKKPPSPSIPTTCLQKGASNGMMIQIENVGLTYQTPGGETEALRGLSFGIDRGAFVGLVGPSGCGKSTLLSILAGLERPTEGRVLLDGKPIEGPSPKVGYMLQKDHLFPWRTVWGNVTLGLELRHDNTPAQQARLRTLLERYGLGEFLSSTPGQLSGGMRQRCALIRTLAQDPDLLLLDEPFSALDYQTRLAVSADIHGIIRAEGKTALMVTHDISEAVSLCDCVVVMTRRPGKVKSIHTLDALRGLSPMARRDHPDFHLYFNHLWKELDVHV